ncbi:DNA starvation/stationary phase protection protein [Ruegeria sediminis]|uniref:DNA starvation/stationary phase protection protein n=1 Tax=Ruegeria sediminis TaxID=2583820 RepID=A0ABY2X3C8_9RHOB|nr:DNA starvation/stationary phase protection protein [Ruegeria sediminis]TMV09887.1 DNA starvation/stationary phase protection protein [Ruegeria sediminis]
MTQQVLKSEPQNEVNDTGIDKNAWIANAITEVLCDSVLLMVKTQGYHWNVVGPLFLPIHELTERQYRDLFEAIDTLAERIRALGQIAPISVTDMISQSRLTEEETVRDAHGMIKQLISDNESLARRLRETAALAARHGDGATEDLMNARMAKHEEAIWMLKAIATA